MDGTIIDVQVVRFADCEVSQSAVQALERSGLTLGECGAEIIFFDHFEPDLALLLHGRAAVAVAEDERAVAEALVPLLRAGALDVIHTGMPAWSDRIRALLERRRRIDQLMDEPMVRENIAGQSPRWRDTLRHAVEMSQSEASVLLTGETGTGKELLTRVIHGLDPRPSKRALVVLDCTTIPAELSGSELFGHERGAFTGALGVRDGIIAQAEGGTLFLDEIGELPLGLQAQLLRVIQEHAYRRVGADSWRSASFRLVCATNRDLEAEVQRGRFRADLFFRIAGSMLRLPTLRERRSDVLPLARFFLRQASQGRLADFEPAVEAHLLRRDFPGNVRELKQLMIRAYQRWVGVGPLGYAALPEEEWAVPEFDLEREFEPVIQKAIASRIGLKEIGRISRELAVRIAVEDTSGNLQKAATLLGVTDRALQIRRAQKLEA